MKTKDLHLPLISGRETDCVARREIRSPWDDRVVGLIGLAGASEIESAISSAESVSGELERTPAWRRAAWLEAIVEGLRRREAEIVRMIAAEAGKPVKLARIETGRAMETFAFSAEEAKRQGGELIPLDASPSGEGRVGITRRFPVGPVAAITPFNFPLNLVAHKVGPAIAAGCPMVLKPADQTPLTALVLGEIVADCGAPPGTLNVVPCEVEAAAALVADPRIAAISFTGSSRVGWEIASKAGRKRALLELGGNGAAIVHHDADTSHAASRCALGAFAYAGQVCISLQRAFVHERVLADFLEKLLSETSSIGVGDPMDPQVLVGPVRGDQDADRIMAWIEEAKSKGARLLCGGRREGRLITPTVLTDVDPDLPICREEVFGPVVIVESYREEGEALELVNRSDYGLQAGIFTSDIRLLMRAFENLKVGAIIHDDAPSFRVDHMPYGGVKNSGVGREGVRWAIEEMTELRMLALRK